MHFYCKLAQFRLLVLWLLLATPIAGAQETSLTGDAEFWSQELQPFLTAYCIDCHAGEESEGGIDFSTYDFSQPESAERLESERPRWNQIRGMIEIGAMPPADYDPLPSRELREKVADWIDRRVNSVECGVDQDPGRVTMRRLNNIEYDNSVRDLLGIDFAPSEVIGFPSDGVGNGFDNQGDVLTLSPLQLEKYMQSAQLIVSKVVVDRRLLKKQEMDIPALYLGDQRSVEFESSEGEYQFKLRLQFEQDGGEKVWVSLLIDDEEVERWEVGNKRSTYEASRSLTAGTHRLTVHYVEDSGAKGKEYRRRIETDAIVVEGPTTGEPPLPEPYARVFRNVPSENSAESGELEAAARENLTPIMRRAFRREPTETEISRTIAIVTLAVEQGLTFEQGIGLGLQSILISPHFLFRVESSPQQGEHQITTLSQYEIASRLAYFLWSSIPDDTLLDLARDGKLDSADVLHDQVDRMLADPKSSALVERFFGQFLGLGGLRDVTPDAEQFPMWNDRLREALRRETELFCREVVSQDLPLSTLLDGDFTFVNPRLAEFYGIDFEGQDPKELFRQGPGLNRGESGARDNEYAQEDRWVRIETPPNRRGVLTQASILTLTSNPTSTSPVKRGKWILESILGDPPPPAPPNVPTFEETKKQHENLSLRQQLELHRINPSCASCHDVMDPLGLGFENFDALGRWRDKDGPHPIDAAGELADGRKFNGAIELVSLLSSRQREIYRFFGEKLLTYALGRGLEPYDQCAIDSMLESVQRDGYTMSAFVKAVVTSDPFLKQRVQEVEQLSADINEEEPSKESRT